MVERRGNFGSVDGGPISRSRQELYNRVVGAEQRGGKSGRFAERLATNQRGVHASEEEADSGGKRVDAARRGDLGEGGNGGSGGE